VRERLGDRLKDHPFFFNVYALKREANAMKPAAGALVWTRSQSAAPDNLDLHISGTHFFDLKASPTGGAIVLASAVMLPKSIGRLRLSNRDPRAMPHIQYNFFDNPNDLDRLMEAVRLSRKIGRTVPFSDLIDHEMAPGNAVDDDEALRANIVATVDAYLHPTSTVPMGPDSDPSAVVDAWGKVRGIEALRVVDASIIPDIPSVPTNVTTIMVAERIAARLSPSACTTQLHVVERFKIVNGGEELEVKVHVEDPGAFTTPWNAVQRYRRDQREQEVPLHEMVCAENNEDHFNQGLIPIPQADKSEF
jgi:choline dehydrogenase